MPTLEEQAAKVQSVASDDPVEFLTEYVGSSFWPMQERIIESVFDNPVTSVRSCHDSGKTYTAARLAIAFLIAHEGAVVLTTAPTARQVREILWREIRAAHAGSHFPLGGDMQTTAWNIAPDWFALGLSTNEPDKFQGYHAPRILVIVDEAPGVGEAIFDAIDGSLASEGSRLFMIGNPTALEGRFYDSHRNPRVEKIHISCFDTPNFTANGITSADQLRNPDVVEKATVTHPYLITPRWAADRLEEWGEESPMFQARVLGEFPSQADDTLIPLNKIEEAQTEERWAKIPAGEPRHGVDVARFGADRTAICFRLGMQVKEVKAYPQADTMGTAGFVINEYKKHRGGRMAVDVIGIGSGVKDRLREQDFMKGAVVGVNVAEKANKPDDFLNLRAELFWRLAQLIIKGQIALPKDKELEAQLANIKFGYDSKGRLYIEKKEDIKKRIGRSPDKADALALSLAHRSEEEGTRRIRVKGSPAAIFRKERSRHRPGRREVL